jgi:hypothetical protein
MSAFPLASTATQSDTEAHDTPSTLVGVVEGPAAWSTTAARQLDAPAAGSVDHSTVPYSPTATHNDADGQDTPSNAYGVPGGR